MLDDIVKNAEQKMHKAVEYLKQDLSNIRTGRASPALLDKVQVEYYGTPTALNAVANITAPEARMLVISPWERTMLGPIEKAIQKSDLGLNPNNDGQVLRLNLPQLTEDRRRDLVKQVQKRAEEARVAVRNVRRDAVDHVRKQDQSGDVSKDEATRAQDRLQKLTDTHVRQIDEVSRKKETEVLEV